MSLLEPIIASVTRVEGWSLTTSSQGRIIAIHQSELSWVGPFVHELHYRVGDAVSVCALKDDPEHHEVIGSVRQCAPHGNIVNDVRFGDEIEGVVDVVGPEYVTLRLAGGQFVDFRREKLPAVTTPLAKVRLYVLDVFHELDFVYLSVERPSFNITPLFEEWVTTVGWHTDWQTWLAKRKQDLAQGDSGTT